MHIARFTEFGDRFTHMADDRAHNNGDRPHLAVTVEPSHIHIPRPGSVIRLTPEQASHVRTAHCTGA